MHLLECREHRQAVNTRFTHERLRNIRSGAAMKKVECCDFRGRCARSTQKAKLKYMNYASQWSENCELSRGGSTLASDLSPSAATMTNVQSTIRTSQFRAKFCVCNETFASRNISALTERTMPKPLHEDAAAVALLLVQIQLGRSCGGRWCRGRTSIRKRRLRRGRRRVAESAALVVSVVQRRVAGQV